MGRKDTYTIVTRKKPGTEEAIGYNVLKFDEDGEHKDTYLLNMRGTTCTCPAYTPYCRHKSMFHVFKDASKIDSGWLYNYDSKTWIEPKSTIDDILGLLEDDIGAVDDGETEIAVE